jgi:hypothetical protein
MLNHLIMSYRRRLLARRTARLLQSTGYTVRELRRLQRLSTEIGVAPHPPRPSIDDVLAAWPH